MAKNLYLVLVCERPGVKIDKIELKPSLPAGVKGYAPIYTNKRQAKKDWPRREIRTLAEIK